MVGYEPNQLTFYVSFAIIFLYLRVMASVETCHTRNF